MKRPPVSRTIVDRPGRRVVVVVDPSGDGPATVSLTVFGERSVPLWSGLLLADELFKAHGVTSRAIQGTALAID